MMKFKVLEKYKWVNKIASDMYCLKDTRDVFFDS